MRKIEGIIKEIIDEMSYLKNREERFTMTNGTPRTALCSVVSPNIKHFTLSVSTNERVQNFAWFTIVSLTGLGVWQILHLRAYFKRKYLID